VANVDQAVVIFAITKPQPNFNLLDRFLIMMGQQKLPCIICFNKLDIDDNYAGEKYCEIYRGCGYQTLSVSAGEGTNIETLKNLLKGKTTTVAGPSGVGKSSIVNRLQSGTVMETGAISEKIERGKHTTRHSELIAIENDTYILDTPGFSSLGLFDIEKEELAGYYPEFATYEKYCKFGRCAHISEPVCGVKDAVDEGKISGLRYENYKMMYEELKDRRRY
jgi:ribosome biogenesis GTPase